MRVRSAMGTVALLLSATLAWGCGSDDTSSTGTSGSTAGSGDGADLVVYSGREQELVEPLFGKFEESSGLQVDVRYGESPELAATLLEEGENSPADVFFAQDAGAMGSVSELLEPLEPSVIAKVPATYRDADNRWTGVTGRVRVLVYNTGAVDEADLPTSVFALTEPEFRGKVGLAPQNASFLGFVTGMRLSAGEEKTLEWLEGMVANEAQIYEKNGAIVDAVAQGEIDYGLVNHYYLYEKRAEDPEIPAENHFFAAGDPGNLVNVSAVGTLTSSSHPEAAQTFVEFLMTEGQTFFADEAEEREYPLAKGAGTPRSAELPPLEQIKGPKVDLGDFGTELSKTSELVEESGLGR